MAELGKDTLYFFDTSIKLHRDRYGGGGFGSQRFEGRNFLDIGFESDKRSRILQTQPRPSATEGRSVGSKSHRASSAPKKA